MLNKGSQLSILTFAMLAIVAFLTFSCNGTSELKQETTVVKGTITVDEVLDDSGDFSGIEILIASYREEREDTVFQAITDIAGYFQGVATFDRKSEYVFLVSRNENRLASAILILADNDTVSVNASLPDFEQTLRISSVENDAYAVYRRLNRQFDRIATLINSGQVPGTEVEEQVLTWSNLFWSMREDYPNTLAASRASATAIEILDGWDDDLVLQRISEVDYDPEVIESILFTGKSAMLRKEGLDATVAFLDDLKSNTTQDLDKILIDINIIELLYDSLRVDDARTRFEAFQRAHPQDGEVSHWSRSFAFDLKNLAPGMPFPEFAITVDGGNPISNAMIEGDIILFDFARLDDRTYQQRFLEMLVLYEEFGDHMRFISVPAHDSQIMINAFFEERGRLWEVADAGEYQRDDFLEQLNLDQFPVRFLVDAEGNIIRKYYGYSLGLVRQDLNNLLP